MIRYLAHFDLVLCVLINRVVNQSAPARLVFVTASRLGDGVFWYALMGVLPLVYGIAGLTAAIHMLVVSALGVLIYKLIKQATGRPRPFSVEEAINLGTPPLDQYSFPSGHTLHAVAFTLIAVHYFPELAWILVPFALLVAASRVVLGLHYPTDVVCGAVLGWALAFTSMELLGA
jgi:undecaprenyl-diphosphatase